MSDPITDLQSQHDANAAGIAKNEAKLTHWSEFLSTPQGRVLVGLIISLLTIGVTWLSGKLDPPPAPAPNVTVHPPVVNVPVTLDGGSKPEPQAVRYIYALYSTKSISDKDKAAAVVLGIEIMPKVYDAGMSLGKVTTPCLVKFDGSFIVDAVNWTGIDDAAKWVKR